MKPTFDFKKWKEFKLALSTICSMFS